MLTYKCQCSQRGYFYFMVITEELRKEYFDALNNQEMSWNAQPMTEFRINHPLEYQYINSVYHKRCKLKKDIKCLFSVSENVYFGTLTFDNEEDKKKEITKRKNAFKFLNNIFGLWCCVEEHGEDNGRYHLHCIGVFRQGKTFNDWFAWSGREDIKKIKKNQCNKVASYLCDYMSKASPRLRRNKLFVQVSRLYQKRKSLNNRGWNYQDKELDCRIKLVIGYALD